MAQATSVTRTPGWSLLTPRGLALLYIARHPGCTKKELAQALRVGDRTVTSTISELTSARAIRASNGDGRRMHYEVNPNALLETPDGDHTTIRALLHSLDR